VIPIARPDVGQEEIDAVAGVLRSGMIAQGPKVRELEERWAAYVGVRHAVAVSNGTVALQVILAGLGIGPGDEVITPSHTFAATANAILSVGAAPVFVDIERDTYLLDPTLVESAITPRTRAIMPVHLFGLVADMYPLTTIAERHGIAVVEDACQAHGASYDGRRAGSFGPAAFSLYATKNMTSGEGGLITTDDETLADWMRRYRNQGMRTRYQFEMLGFNYRMTDINAAIALVQLDKLDRNNERRRSIAAAYTAGLCDLALGLPVVPAGREHVFHQFAVRVGPRRDDVLAALRDDGIGADVYYPLPVHRQPYLRDLVASVALPETDAAAAETLALPMHPALTDDEVSRVVTAFRRALA